MGSEPVKPVEPVVDGAGVASASDETGGVGEPVKPVEPVVDGAEVTSGGADGVGEPVELVGGVDGVGTEPVENLEHEQVISDSQLLKACVDEDNMDLEVPFTGETACDAR